MERWRGRVALVTGGSMGIGAEITRTLVKHGMKVAAGARSIDKLQALTEELSGEAGKILPIQCDLQQEDQILAMFDKIKAEWGGVDVCVNNAGMSLNNTLIIDGDSERWRSMLDVMVVAACLCTRESVKSMRSRNVDDGQIININSLSGHRVGTAHFYSVCKFALSAATEGIRWELRNINSHIRVAQISPGLTESNFHAIQMEDEAAAEDLYQRKQCLKPEDIAGLAISILSTPAHVQVHDILVRPTEQQP